MNEHTEHLPEKILEHIEQSDYDFVLFTKFVNHPGSSLYKLGYTKMCKAPKTDIVDQFSELTQGDKVFQKDTYSAFKLVKFCKFLDKNKIKEIEICGCDTDACVLATSYEGFDLGYQISVLDDLTASCHGGKEFRDYGLAIINKNIDPK